MAETSSGMHLDRAGSDSHDIRPNTEQGDERARIRRFAVTGSIGVTTSSGSVPRARKGRPQPCRWLNRSQLDPVSRHAALMHPTRSLRRPKDGHEGNPGQSRLGLSISCSGKTSSS
jgi:hypothetical protein